MKTPLRPANSVGFLTVATIAPDYYGGGFPPIFAHRLVAAAWCGIKPAQGISKKNAVPPEVEVQSVVAKDLLMEEEILAWCRERIQATYWTNPPGTLVTFYGDLFTLPLLCWRACSYGMPFPLPPPQDRLDLADCTNFGFGDVKRLSISDCAEYMGMPKRFTTDIQDRFFGQDLASIRGFVETDLLIFSLCWLRFMLVMSFMTKPQFTATGHATMKALHSRTNMAKEYIRQFDYRKFLLLPPKNDPSCY